ncbi:helix-turn-helix domain-containing protein [Kroppenstedtia eburnea]|uniref:HTH cro/C1-type domain-containing protein n=1 Tax=Kroppenstedtia guangzhouensis TaxID=1274356 RepID=A0ABQ1GGC4_9BACL|nr:helix-turn-helix domain-containing protein [Kroppenstedtia guangzhouensis]EGK08263.1 helix-turn-helix/TPR domain protein [Desmospora sp. 8437]GGA43318.1 hypothetical protein GCM10007416_15470 [Kroppenstedtia guangzhouensis]
MGYEMSEIGELIRRVRKLKGLRLEDLADENISPATISNVERGVSHVRQDKMFYLLEKLGISIEEIPTLLLEEKKEADTLKFELLFAESLQRMGFLDEAIQVLKRLNLPNDHPFAPSVYWLIGGTYLLQKRYQKAERSLSEAIRLSKQSDYAMNENIEAYSFNDLGLCSYHENNIEQAIQYTRSGLDAFNVNGKNKIVKYNLIRNLAVYLERTGRVVEALRVVQDVWEEVPNIGQKETVLGFYWLKGELLRRSGSLKEAEITCQEGLKLAGYNEDYSSSFDLWVVLGSIFMDKRNWEKAEGCFEIALKIAEKYVSDSRLVRGYIQLGQLKTRREGWEEAEQILKKAIGKGEELSCVPYLLDAYLAMGDLYLIQRNLEKATYYYKMVIAKPHGYKEKERQAWFQLAKCWKGRDEEEFRRCTENMFELEEEMEGGELA